MQRQKTTTNQLTPALLSIIVILLIALVATNITIAGNFSGSAGNSAGVGTQSGSTTVGGTVTGIVDISDGVRAVQIDLNGDGKPDKEIIIEADTHSDYYNQGYPTGSQVKFTKVKYGGKDNKNGNLDYYVLRKDSDKEVTS